MDFVLFVRNDGAVVLRLETLLLPAGTADDLIVKVPWVSLDLEVVVTQVTLHPELIDRRGVVHPDFGLLGIIPNTHPDMVSASCRKQQKTFLKKKGYNLNQLIYRMTKLKIIFRQPLDSF